MDTQTQQAEINKRDLQIGRLFVSITDVLAQAETLKQQAQTLQQTVHDLEDKHRRQETRIDELLAMVDDLTQDADDDESDDDCDGDCDNHDA